jgi:hypothetical protein
MDSSSIITQANRDDEPLNGTAASEKSNNHHVVRSFSFRWRIVITRHSTTVMI